MPPATRNPRWLMHAAASARRVSQRALSQSERDQAIPPLRGEVGPNSDDPAQIQQELLVRCCAFRYARLRPVNIRFLQVPAA